MIVPAWLLLAWSGLAAASAAAIVAPAVGGVPVASWSLAPAPRSRAHGALWSFAAGVIAYPLLYGVIFELLHRADLRTGLLVGLLHALIMFAVARPNGTVRAALRVAVAHVVYGAMLAFLYVTP